VSRAASAQAQASTIMAASTPVTTTRAMPGGATVKL
jgi:hypothetical protein